LKRVILNLNQGSLEEEQMQSKSRNIRQVIDPVTVREGAGVLVQRSIAGPHLNYLDPFLLLDHFSSRERQDYEAGFPLHPHRGIETVTYVLEGNVHHRDTMGNEGSIGAGDIQWMTSGGGLMHEEMPQVRPEGISGFQLWVNLPAKLKMSKPAYRDVRSDSIPEVVEPNGTRVRVIAGDLEKTIGPVTGIAAEPRYLDILVPPKSMARHAIPRGHSAFAYVFEGAGIFRNNDRGDESLIKAPRLVILEDGDFIDVKTDKIPVRFLLVSGKPLNEPVARYGPFVMNTREEIEKALDDLRRGTFIAEP
jgi:quercetin 2,3-dioxygenase